VRIGALISLMIGLLAACGTRAPKEQTLRVAAAASLRLALEEVNAAFMSLHPDVEVLLNVAASGVLRRQIEEGDAADVFISADPVHTQALVQEGHVPAGSVRTLVSNRLVVAAPRGERLALTSLRGLASPEFQRIAIGTPASAPVGKYAEAALRASGVWEVLQPRLIYAENASQIAAHLSRGEVDAAILYATDVRPLGNSARVVLQIDPSLHPPIVYTIAPVSGSRARTLARQFIAFAMSGEGQAILGRHGFIPAE
jgi:molybdate transport system substrate-binding protein